MCYFGINDLDNSRLDMIKCITIAQKRDVQNSEAINHLKAIEKKEKMVLDRETKMAQRMFQSENDSQKK